MSDRVRGQLSGMSEIINHSLAMSEVTSEFSTMSDVRGRGQSSKSGVRVQTGSQAGSNVKRCANFKPSEDETLINEVEKRKSKLFGTFSSSLTKSIKNVEWRAVTAKINEVSNVKRSVMEVKQRWKNVKSVSKKSLGSKMNPQYMNQTGSGGPREQLSSSEVRMLGVIGHSSVCGVSGGFDTSLSQACLAVSSSSRMFTAPSSAQITATPSTLRFAAVPPSSQPTAGPPSSQMAAAPPSSQMAAAPSGSQIAAAPLSSRRVAALPSSQIEGVEDGLYQPEDEVSDVAIISTVGIGSGSTEKTPEADDSNFLFGEGEDEEFVTPRRNQKDTEFVRKPRENTNTKLLKIQAEILTELKEIKETSRKRLLVEQERLDLDKEAIQLKKRKLLLSNPELTYDI